MIDLRSDTVTAPTPAMREAMATAAVGDDVYGEDPTVNRLEAEVAGLLGKAAAVFLPTGTMGNLIALLVHCRRGQEALVSDESHIYHFEAGGASALGGIAYHPVPTRTDGTMPIEALYAAIRPVTDVHQATAGVICLENTQNRCGGRVLGPAYLKQVQALAEGHDLPIHVDGARLFNAAVALGVPVRDLAEPATSVQVCLSKGLAAPAGSLLAGPAPFIAQARRYRKMLGGGMRQAGVLAAAGLVALAEMVERLADDHRRAHRLSEALGAIPGIALDPAAVATNILVFEVFGGVEPLEFKAGLEAEGVLISAFGPTKLRMVTHYGISDDDCETVVASAGRVAARLGAVIRDPRA